MTSTEKFNQIINEGVEKVNEESKSGNLLGIREIQKFTMNYLKENNVPQLVEEIIKEDPSRRTELQKRIIAFSGEGKHLEDSMIS